MDDTAYQSWSDDLAKLREHRFKTIQQAHRQRGAEFLPGDFFDLSMASLNAIVAKWWSIEQLLLKEGAFAPTSVGPLESVLAELDSIIEFEIESIERDLATFRERVSWDSDAVDKELSHFSGLSREVRKSTALKIKAQLGSSAPVSKPDFIPSPPFETENREAFSPIPPFPSPPIGNPYSNPPPPPPPLSPPPVRKKAGGRSSGGGSGVFIFIMFVVGLVLGSGPALYFWEAGKKTEVEFQAEVDKLTSEKKELEDRIGIYRQHLKGIATGRVRTIPQLEAVMQPVKEDIALRRRNVQEDYNEKRAALLKRVPAGDRQDRAVKRLQVVRDESLTALQAEEKRRLAPLLNEQQILKDLIE